MRCGTEELAGNPRIVLERFAVGGSKEKLVGVASRGSIGNAAIELGQSLRSRQLTRSGGRIRVHDSSEAEVRISLDCRREVRRRRLG